ATSISFRTLLGIDNFSLALKARDLCNKYGLDIFKVGYTLSWAFESYEKGLLNKDDTNGLELKWGNEDILIKLIKKMAKKEGFGKILSSGAAKAAEKYGEKAKKHALAVKEQELEGMPLRKAYVPALGIATAEPGPDHTRFYPPYPPNPSILNEQIKEDLPFDISNALDTSSPVEKGTLVKWLTDSRAVLESFPFCVFLARDKVHVDFRFWTELFNAATGMELSFDDLMKAGERIVNLERSMIVRYGYRRGDDTLPGRMLEDSAPSRYVSSISNETLEKMKDNYYKDREWDKDTGIPTKNKLNDLELHFVVEDLEEDGIYEED
ncbi:MAG: aldehyde ferredoxin oxidoreductase C-terminal domain-containing protein, partial [Thermoplasmatota archaeon]